MFILRKKRFLKIGVKILCNKKNFTTKEKSKLNRKYN